MHIHVNGSVQDYSQAVLDELHGVIAVQASLAGDAAIDASVQTESGRVLIVVSVIVRSEAEANAILSRLRARFGTASDAASMMRLPVEAPPVFRVSSFQAPVTSGAAEPGDSPGGAPPADAGTSIGLILVLLIVYGVLAAICWFRRSRSTAPALSRGGHSTRRLCKGGTRLIDEGTMASDAPAAPEDVLQTAASSASAADHVTSPEQPDRGATFLLQQQERSDGTRDKSSEEVEMGQHAAIMAI